MNVDACAFYGEPVTHKKSMKILTNSKGVVQYANRKCRCKRNHGHEEPQDEGPLGPIPQQICKLIRRGMCEDVKEEEKDRKQGQVDYFSEHSRSKMSGEACNNAASIAAARGESIRRICAILHGGEGAVDDVKGGPLEVSRERAAERKR